MRSISTFLVMAVVFMVAVVAGVCADAAIGAPAQIQIQQDSAFQGTLLKVDANNHMLTVKAVDGKEWVFIYTDETKVIGPARDVEGLTGKPGANLKITYHVENLANRATQIEVIP